MIFGDSTILYPEPNKTKQGASIDQSILVMLQETDFKKALSKSKNYYKYFNIYYNIEKKNKIYIKEILIKDIKKPIKVLSLNYVLLLKSSYLVKHLYSNTSIFIKQRRDNYKYYLDKIKNNEIIDLPVFNLTPPKPYLSEGNHRVLAMYDSGFKAIPCEVVIDYHKAFRYYTNVDFIDRW